MFGGYLRFIGEFPWVMISAAFAFGAIIGSFLNVCIYRLPAGLSVVTPGSHCACGRPIAWYHNIPILSWIFLRGRASCCGQRFSWRYPFVELLTAVLFMASWLAFPPAKAICGMILMGLLVVATFVDLDHYIIPESCSLGGAVVGMFLSFLVPSLHHQSSGIYLVSAMRSALIGFEGLLIGSALLLWVALLAETILKKEAMGFGDIKFLGAIGAFCGWQGALFSIFGGAVISTVWTALAMLGRSLVASKEPDAGVVTPLPDAEKTPTEALLNPSMGTHIPYGPMLAAAAAIYFLWMQPMVDRYFETLGALFVG